MASSSYFYSIQGHPPYDDDIESTSSSSSFQEVENGLTLHSIHSTTESAPASASDSVFADETNHTQSNSIHRHVIRIRRKRHPNNNYTYMIDPESHWYDHHHHRHNSIIRKEVSSVIPHSIYVPMRDYDVENSNDVDSPRVSISVSESDIGYRDAAPEGTVVNESYDDNCSDNYSYVINSSFDSNDSNDDCRGVVNNCHGYSCDLTLMEELSKSISVHSMTYDDTWGMTTAMLIE